MDQKVLAGILEGILFTMGNTVEIERLMEALEVTREEIDGAVSVLEKQYRSDCHGLRVIRLEDSLQLCTKPELFDSLVKIAAVPKKRTISPAMLEALSIVAYRQPVTRADIERIRGVACDYAVNRLIEFGLIEEVGRLDAPGRPILFATTEEFLRCFGLSSVTQLPMMGEEQIAQLKKEVLMEVGRGGEIDDAADADTTVADSESTEAEAIVQEAFEADEIEREEDTEPINVEI